MPLPSTPRSGPLARLLPIRTNWSSAVNGRLRLRNWMPPLRGPDFFGLPFWSSSARAASLRTSKSRMLRRPLRTVERLSPTSSAEKLKLPAGHFRIEIGGAKCGPASRPVTCSLAAFFDLFNAQHDGLARQEGAGNVGGLHHATHRRDAGVDAGDLFAAEGIDAIDIGGDLQGRLVGQAAAVASAEHVADDRPGIEALALEADQRAFVGGFDLHGERILIAQHDRWRGWPRACRPCCHEAQSLP